VSREPNSRHTPCSVYVYSLHTLLISWSKVFTSKGAFTNPPLHSLCATQLRRGTGGPTIDRTHKLTQVFYNTWFQSVRAFKRRRSPPWGLFKSLGIYGFRKCYKMSSTRSGPHAPSQEFQKWMRRQSTRARCSLGVDTSSSQHAPGP